MVRRGHLLPSYRSLCDVARDPEEPAKRFPGPGAGGTLPLLLPLLELGRDPKFLFIYAQASITKTVTIYEPPFQERRGTSGPPGS